MLDYLKSREKSAYCHRFDAVLWSEEGSLKIHRFATRIDMHIHSTLIFVLFLLQKNFEEPSLTRRVKVSFPKWLKYSMDLNHIGPVVSEILGYIPVIHTDKLQRLNIRHIIS